MKKRILALLIIAMLTLSLCACKSTDDEEGAAVDTLVNSKDDQIENDQQDESKDESEDKTEDESKEEPEEEKEDEAEDEADDETEDEGRFS